MRFFFHVLILGSALSACTRPEGSETSGITIDTRSFRKVSAQSLPPENETCFAVDLRGAGIEETSTGSCFGALGASAGFIKGGEPISLKAPRGPNRTLRVLMFQRAADADCPDVVFALGNGPSLVKTYVVGNVPGIELAKETETIEVAVSFPGASNHVAAAPSCTTPPGAGSSPTGGWRSVRNVIASGSVADTDLKLKIKVLSPGVLR